MAVPFGFSVGDFIAIGKLIGQVVSELRQNDSAASEYQSIVIELEALQRALRQLHTLRPAKRELLQLTSIRATVLACQGPLRDFLDKVSKFERRLGTFNTAGSKWSGLSRRMQFRVLFKEDVKQLRSVLASHIGTINVLLMTQAVASISIAEEERENYACSLETKILVHRRLLEHVNDRVGTSLTQQRHIETQLESQDGVLATLDKKADSTCNQLYNQAASIRDLQTTATTSQKQTNTILGTMAEILALITSGMLQIHQIAQQLQLMLRLCATFTTDMRRTMSKVMEVFTNVQTLLQRLDSRLPTRPYLPIIQFTTALGDTIALPYQLCQQWTTFTELLKVVFLDKPGEHRVHMGMYSIMHARGGRLLMKDTWQHAIIQDDHLSMSIVLDDVAVTPGACPFPTCGARTDEVKIENGGRRCTTCQRWSSLLVSEPQGPRPSVLDATDEDDDEEVDGSTLTEIEEDIEVYRQVLVRLPVRLREPDVIPLDEVSAQDPGSRSDSPLDETSPWFPGSGLDRSLPETSLHQSSVWDPASRPESPVGTSRREITTCKECGKQFTGRYQRGNFARHTRQQHPEKTPSVKGECICRVCKKGFNRQDARRKHEWKKHQLEDVRPSPKRATLNGTMDLHVAEGVRMVS